MLLLPVHNNRINLYIIEVSLLWAQATVYTTVVLLGLEEEWALWPISLPVHNNNIIEVISRLAFMGKGNSLHCCCIAWPCSLSVIHKLYLSDIVRTIRTLWVWYINYLSDHTCWIRCMSLSPVRQFLLWNRTNIVCPLLYACVIVHSSCN